MKSLLFVSLVGYFAAGDSSSLRESDELYAYGSKRALRGAHPETNRRSMYEMGPHNVNRSMGEKELLVVRIKANDSSTTASEEQLFKDIFDAAVSVSKQLEACSHRKLSIKPATGRNINNGVTTVKFDSSVLGKSTDDILKEVDSNSISLFGRSLNEFDHVMMCMPPGTPFVNPQTGPTTRWHAYVPGNWDYTDFLSVYNDHWCTSVSAGMHEIGHNLGLEHSNEAGATYEDETGQMGFSGLKGSSMANRCYNPAKSWQLGWYSEHSRRINPYNDAPFQTILTGITNPPQDGDTSKNILLQIPNGQTDIYIGYNLAEGYNSGTFEGQNMVLVNEKETGLRTFSNLLSKMGNKDSYKISNYLGRGKDLVIEWDERISSDNEALIKVYFEDDNVSIEDGCNDDQVRFEVSVKTDDYPVDTSWQLIDDRTRAVVALRSKGNFQKSMTHNDLICIDRDRDFTFILYDDYQDGICCHNGWGAYSVFLDGKEIFHGGDFNAASVSHNFRTKNRETNDDNVNPTCEDNPFFRYKRVKKCTWIAKDPENRCQKKWGNKTVEDYCPKTCGKCQAGVKEERYIDTVCTDSSDYRYRGRKSCAWVAEKKEERCNKKWKGEYVSQHCKATCDICESNAEAV